MEGAALSLDGGSMDQLDHDLDFDFSAEGFDFQIDAAYDQDHDQTEDHPDGTAPTADNHAPQPDDDEIGEIISEEAGQEDAGGDAGQETTTGETGHDAGRDDTGEIDFSFEDGDDEIGYEEDDTAAADASLDLGPGEAAKRAEHAAEATEDASTQPGLGSGSLGELERQQEGSGTEEEDDEVVLDDYNNIEVDEHTNENEDKQSVEGQNEDHERDLDEHQDEDIDMGPSELDKAIQDLANSLPGIPEVEVLYNEATYMLFGSSDDDPESYFLPDTRQLDRSLSEFLVAIRQVISNEILPSDVLLVSCDSLDLEFGERSNEKFLNRTLREVLDCYAALASRDDDIPPTPTLQLIVQLDCEERFLQLLHDAGLSDEQSDGSERFDQVADQDLWLETDVRDDDDRENGHPAEPPAVSEAAGNIVTANAVATPVAQDGGENSVSIADEQKAIVETQASEFHDASTAHESPALNATDHIEEDQMNADGTTEYHHDVEDGGFDIDDPANAASEEVYSEVPGQPVEQVDTDAFNNESTEDAGLNVLDEIVVANDDGLGQITDSNGKSHLSLPPSTSLSSNNIPLAVDKTDSGSLIDYTDDEEPVKLVPLSNLRPKSRNPTQSTPSIHVVNEQEPSVNRSESSDSLLAQRASRMLHQEDRERKKDSEMLGFQPSQRTFFTSHSRTGSDMSIAPSSFSDTNRPNFQGDDVLLAYEENAEFSATLERDDHAEEEIIVAIETEINTTDDHDDENLAGQEQWRQETSATSQSATPTASHHSQTGAYFAAATDSGSVHTSTTMNGDDIDYEEYGPADGSYNSGDDGQPLTAEDGGEDDEIDWENDALEDEDDQSVTDEPNTPKNQQEPSLTPSSLAGKRTRTDEAESLAEESGMTVFSLTACRPFTDNHPDYKRRRT
ncbi:hypothetical protein QBC35DRAFT_378115 [Podospora australis]|uniref:Glutamic acid-rich protein n=1 Tax=Podospora australis TaxID=1536484 RepID=A0AAN6WYD0_9PEZI|nr:hypothetical protein QBC35DRAFT_378115 [Podospora australis]